MTYKPHIALDFDGVIHSYTSGWEKPGIVRDPPTPGAIEFILELLPVATVSIYSARSKYITGRWAMKSWLRSELRNHYMDMTAEQQIKSQEGYDGWTMDLIEQAADVWALRKVREVNWPWFKPSAFVTIDDRAITFTGVFPKVGELFQFKPWNKE